MRRINIYAITLGAILLLGACSDDFLDTEPMTELSGSNYPSSPDHAYDLLVGCYDAMQIAEGASKLSFPLASEILSDDCFGGTGNSDPYNYQALDELDISRAPSFIDLYNDTWTKYYATIFRCNTLLKGMDKVDWTGKEEERDQYESEARFIRAYTYFDLARLFGRVPLLTEPSEENIPQSSPEEIYTVIAEDLLFASKNMPQNSYDSVPNGRITTWAAKSMLARVYLYYTGYYGKSDLVGVVDQSQVLSYLEDVIANSGHSLVSDFSSLWPAASVDDYIGEANSEIVFSVKFTYTSDYNGNTDGNHWMVLFGMRNFSYFPYGRGWGVSVNPDLYEAYSPEDSRRFATVTSVKDEEIPFNVDKQLGQREYTGYYNKKYSPRSAYDKDNNLVDYPELFGGTDYQINQFQDYFVIRYSDVLLMAAELGSPNAQQYFDEVRERAYGEDYNQVAVSQENIQKERHLEFALEGIRYWDLLRQGIETAASKIATKTPVLNGGSEATKTISADRIITTQGLQQIPNTQITRSGNLLEQNPGW